MASRLVVYTLTGSEGRTNQAVYASPPGQAENAPLLVYFGGDVQDFHENMHKHRDNHQYSAWSLESTAELLARSAPSSHILVVRPEVLELGTFSCYNNFVESNKFGIPDHDPSGRRAMDHLRALLQSLAEQCDQVAEVDQLPKTLIAFSKGTVVLNQLLMDLSQLGEDSQMASFVNSIRRWCWLDGGHSGGRMTWITHKPHLMQFAKWQFRVDVRVTPYQVEDTQRPWIKQEEKQFSGFLTRSGVDVTRKKFFMDEPPSIHNHFQILRTLLDHPLD
eukprot:snap_masked-scaffold527_size145964-processed-gene-0.4 protein:Tk02379 transcript:snap_masked-scaffold527_size145964-processed-gene-0.4-mRNA-1 annotation:"upf0565 protein c2orf69 homolog isoform x2"